MTHIISYIGPTESAELVARFVPKKETNAENPRIAKCSMTPNPAILAGDMPISCCDAQPQLPRASRANRDSTRAGSDEIHPFEPSNVLVAGHYSWSMCCDSGCRSVITNRGLGQWMLVTLRIGLVPGIQDYNGILQINFCIMGEIIQ